MEGEGDGREGRGGSGGKREGDDHVMMHA